MDFTHGAIRPPRLFATLLGLISLLLIVGGIQLLVVGGSPYYLLTGSAIMASAVLLWAGRPEGVWCYAAMLVGTTGWGFWESGWDSWALLPRLGGPVLLGGWMLMPWFRRRLRAPAEAIPQLASLANLPVLLAGFAIALIAGSGLHALRPLPLDPALAVSPSAPFRAEPAPFSVYPPAAEDWAIWGGDPGGRRYSSLVQITPTNVADLKPIWTAHVEHSPLYKNVYFQATPIKIDDTLYLCTGYNDVIALDAETGEQRWRFNADLKGGGLDFPTCRGVAFYQASARVSDCPERIITNTIDARLIALDAHTGALCSSFGKGGMVSLLTGMGERAQDFYWVTSAPTIANGKVVLGGWVTDGRYFGEPSGVIRAFDATTGAFAWAFDMGRPTDHGEPITGHSYTPSTPNSWAPMSVDEQLGLVFVPTGNATGTDWYGAQRRPFDERYSSSILALDAATGDVRWSFQTLHHDLWDYDVASQPTLVDLPAQDGGVVPALIQPTKRGDIFVLNRVTGQPITTVVEQPVPSDGAAPGERVAKTQPFSIGMPSLSGPALSESTMWGITPLDQMWCRIQFKRARYDGPLTPPSLTPYIIYPGTSGGINWGSTSIDPGRGVMVVNTLHFANYAQLISRADAEKQGIRTSPGHQNISVFTADPQGNTPFAGQVLPFLSPLGVPCQQPPYGLLTAIDLKTHKVIWSRPLGTAMDSGPLGLRSHLPIPMGNPNSGGSMVTAAGLIFIAATQEQAIRAVDISTGKVLWKNRLPAGGHASPMTYISKASGRQFIVIAAGGHQILMSGRSDAVVAYALPKH